MNSLVDQNHNALYKQCVHVFPIVYVSRLYSSHLRSSGVYMWA